MTKPVVGIVVPANCGGPGSTHWACDCFLAARTRAETWGRRWKAGARKIRADLIRLGHEWDRDVERLEAQVARQRRHLLRCGGMIRELPGLREALRISDMTVDGLALKLEKARAEVAVRDRCIAEQNTRRVMALDEVARLRGALERIQDCHRDSYGRCEWCGYSEHPDFCVVHIARAALSPAPEPAPSHPGAHPSQPSAPPAEVCVCGHIDLKHSVHRDGEQRPAFLWGCSRCPCPGYRPADKEDAK